MTVAAGIDCGTNSIRLLVADVAADGSLVDLTREMQIVRLGQGVDATGRLAPEAIGRTRVALAGYRATIDRLGATAVRMVATSATRDAANRDDFVEVVRTTLGADPEVITGLEEASLSFRGAAAGLGARVQRPALDDPATDLLVIDLGGGSTELVRGRVGAPEAVAAYSMDVGCVRMTERHLVSDPPTAAEIAAVEADVNAAIDRATLDVDLTGATAVVGVAGTVTTVAAIALDVPRYDPDVLDGAVVSAAEVDQVAELLLGMTREQRAAIPSMHPGRVDIIGAGALVLRCIMQRIGAAELIASEHDILDGITVSAARRSA
ncbi:Ppx/GppA phosphatase family protein [Jatrophihabitans sp. YIM 134969]